MTHETFVSKKNLQDILDGIEQKIAGLGSTLTGIYTWQANNQYKAGDVCILNGSLFICLATHTSSPAFSTDIANWQLVYSDIDEWASSTYYVAGASVIANNAMYKCKTTHTSGSTFDSTEEANWDVVVGTSGNVKIKNWATTTQYKQYDVVMVNNNLYRCTTNHTSTTFSSDISNWELIYASIGNWQASTYYPVGVFAINDKKLYKCKTQHTSGSTFSDTNWDLIAGGSGAEIKNWATSIQYKVGDLVIRENNLYRCKTAHTSSAFNTDIANWVKLDNIPDWASSKAYFVDDIVIYNNNIYKCVTAHTSASIFDKSKWQILGMTVTAPIKVGEVGFVSWQYALMPDNLSLDGSTINNFKATYPELYDFFNTNGVLTTTLATYTANKALCYYDSTNDIATMPNFLDKTVWGGNTIDEKQAGLPNITGRIEVYQSISGHASTITNGCVTTTVAGRNAAPASSNNDFLQSSIDASQSNSIYGNSTTVQPPAIQLIPQIRYRQDVVEGTVEHYDNAPIGTVISFMGVNAPNEFLICDGSTYNINDYWELAEFIKSEFGTYNHFGGDGTTTFAVPDLRGEFLRGTGTNSHANQGSGASVGVHQDGTEFLSPQVDSSSKLTQWWGANDWSMQISKADGTKTTSNRLIQIASSATKDTSQTATNGICTSRPTNTSVLYCIKYTNSLTMQPANVYSTTEKRIGTWVDGKPLYQKTYELTSPPTVDTSTELGSIPSDTNASTIKDISYVLCATGPYTYATGHYAGASDYVTVWVRANNQITCRVGLAVQTNTSLIVTIKYTKL